MEEKYLICEDSLEGIFTGIYEAYVLRENHEFLHIQIGEDENMRLFAKYLRIEADPIKAVKVSRTILRDMGEEAYLDICRALASESLEKGEAVYKTVVCGLEHKKHSSEHKTQSPRQEKCNPVMGNLANTYVHKVFELSRNAGNEIHHLKGFLRFQELENGIMFARIGPKNNIITFLAPHFADRLPLLNFVIYDDKRGIFVVHPASKPWYLVTDTALDENVIGNYSETEVQYQELFKHFCHKIAIDERKNPKLQQNMLPLRFQEYMVEFGKK